MSYSLILQNEIRNRGLGERKRGREGGKGRKKKRLKEISVIFELRQSTTRLKNTGIVT